MNTHCNAIVIPTQRPLLQRWWLALAETWKAWQARARLDAELRSLQGLQDATLRDIGMTERVLRQPTVSLIDYERGRW